MDFVAGVMTAAIAVKREILMGLAGGVFFALAMFFCRPLLRWSAPRNDVRRLVYSEALQPVSTYVLVGLGYGLQMAGVLVLIPLRATRPPLETWATGFVVAFLFILGSAATVRIATGVAKRLAKQVVELQASASRPSR
jgi:hypothetical protein